MFDELYLTDFDKAPLSLKTILKGRTLQCAIAVIDLVPRGERGDKFKVDTMNLAFNTLCEESPTKSAGDTSLKLVAIKCLVRYSRKYKQDELA